MKRFNFLPSYHYEDTEGTSSVEVKRSVGLPMRSLKIYGASNQDGEPSADNPVPIVSVGDKTKNLIDTRSMTVDTANGLTFVRNRDASITVNGTATSDTFLQLIDITDKTKTYYLSGCPSGSSYAACILCTYVKENVWKAEQYDVGNGLLLDLPNSTVDFDTVRIRIFIKSGTTVENMVFKPMLVEDETATDYEPYGYKIPVEMSGKNLLDKARSSNEAIQNETAGQFWGTVSDYDYVNALLEPNTTYTLSCDIECTEIPNITISDKSLGFRFNRGVTGYSHLGSLKSYQISEGETLHFSTTFSTPSNVEDGRYRLAAYSNYYKDEDGNTASATVIFKNIQLEKSETETGYEAYVKPVTTNIYIDEPLRKVGDTQDMLDVKTGILTRIVEVIDDTGEKTIDESLGVLETPEEESTVPFDEIKVLKGDISIKVLTEICPSKTEAQIYKY